MHNILSVTQNAIVFVASKVKDKVLQVMIVLIIVLQSTAPSNPVASLPCALLKALNSLVINQVCMPSGKLKAAKTWPELTEA